MQPFLRAAGALFLVFSAAAAGAQTRAPRISEVFPPPQDIRDPDLTIPAAPVVVAYDAQGRELATIDANGTIKIWEARTGEQGTGELLRTIDGLARPAMPADPPAAKGKRFSASASKSGDIELRDTATGNVLRTIKASAVPITAIAFDNREEQIASGDANGAVKVWDTSTGALLCEQRGHTKAINSISFASNGQKFATGSADGTARTWTVPLSPLPQASIDKIALAAKAVSATAKPQRPRRILVFWRADAILHKSGVAAVNDALERIGKNTGAFEADFSRDFEVFDPKVLANYDAIVMNSTAHLVMPDYAKRAYLDYAKNGGGVIGIHAAIDTFLPWPEGAAVIGATFGDHPWVPTGTWAVKLEEPSHPLVKAFNGQGFKIKDEFYVMGEPFSRKDRRVLLSVDLSDPASAGVNLNANKFRAQDHDFALAWIKHYGNGRVFYADFGHIDEPFWRPEILQFYLDGIQYVLGDLKVDDAPRLDEK